MGTSQDDRIDESLSQENFPLLLEWLDSDRELAGGKYENIRLALIEIFSARRCANPEDLTDITINRVANKIKGIRQHYVGDPAHYFHAVARRVHQEYLRQLAKVDVAPVTGQFLENEIREEVEIKFDCLEKCLQTLTPSNRGLILRYYQERKSAKIEQKKDLAAELGISLNGLRIRAFRIRAALQQCVQECIKKQNSNSF